MTAAWIADWWPNLAIAALAIAVIAWACRPPHNDYRSRNDRIAAQHITRHEPRPEPAAPGNDDRLLEQCRAICPDLRKEAP